MSRVTVAISKIIEDLDKISGLSGNVSEYVENLQTDIHNRINWLLTSASEQDECDGCKRYNNGNYSLNCDNCMRGWAEGTSIRAELPDLYSE